MGYVTTQLPRGSLGDWTDDAKVAAQQYFGKAQAAATTEVEKLKVAAYDYAYREGRELLATIQNLPAVQRVVTVGNQAYDLGQSIYTAVDKFRSGEVKFDPSGVMATVQMAQSIVQLGTNFAQLFGADDAVTNEINAWMGVGATCATSMVAGSAAPPWGTVAGAAVCAFSVIAKLFASLAGPDYPSPPAHQARALFTPTREQLPHVQRDAMRLASVLHYWYGQKNLDEIVGRLRWWRYFQSGEMGTFPTKPPVDPDTGALAFNERDSNESIPATDVYALLQACSFGSSAAEAGPNLRRCLLVVAAQRLDHEHNAGIQIPLPDLVRHYIHWHDINTYAVRSGAAIGRAAYAAYGQGVFPWTVLAGGAAMSPANQAWYNEDFFDDEARAGDRSGPTDFTAFIRLSELLNYFAAIVLGELADSTRSTAAKAEYAFLSSRLPVRYLGAVGGDNKAYSPRCWTTLQRAAKCIDPSRPGDDILSQVQKGNLDAIYEYALIRLCAALSHMVLYYTWSGRASDAIAEVASRASTAGTYAARFEAPIDPRQLIGNKLRSYAAPTPAETTQTSLKLAPQWGLAVPALALVGKENGLGSADPMRGPREIQAEAKWAQTNLAPIVAAARKQAYADHDASLRVGGKAASMIEQSKTIAGAQKVTATTIVELGASLQTFAMFKSKCAAAGGVASGEGSKWLCTPTAETRAKMEAACRAKGYEPTWVQNSSAVQLVCRPRAEQATTGSGAGVAMLAGLAILVVKLMR